MSDNKKERKRGKKRKRLESNNGYELLPLSLSSQSPWVKYLYCKEQKNNLNDKESDEISDKPTLFMSNLSPYSTKDDIVNIFTGINDVYDVKLESFLKHKKQKTGKNVKLRGEPDEKQMLIIEEKRKREEEKKLPSERESFIKSGYSHVIFQNEDAIDKFKKSSSSDFESKSEESTLCGLNEWIQKFNQEINFDISDLQQSVDSYMFEFDKREIEHKKKVDELTSMPDKDGWVTVTSKGRKKTAGTGGARIGATNLSQEALMQLKEKEKKKLQG